MKIDVDFICSNSSGYCPLCNFCKIKENKKLSIKDIMLYIDKKRNTYIEVDDSSDICAKYIEHKLMGDK